MTPERITKLNDHRPHISAYVVCMECTHDWVAVAPANVQWPIECGECGAMAGETVQIHDACWFSRFMSGADNKKRTLVCLNAGRMENKHDT